MWGLGPLLCCKSFQFSVGLLRFRRQRGVAVGWLLLCGSSFSALLVWRLSSSGHRGSRSGAIGPLLCVDSIWSWAVPFRRQHMSWSCGVCSAARLFCFIGLADFKWPSSRAMRDLGVSRLIFNNSPCAIPGSARSSPGPTRPRFLAPPLRTRRRGSKNVRGGGSKKAF